MKLKNITKRIILLFAVVLIQLINYTISGQNWSLEYVLKGDSSVYTLSRDNVIKGKSIDFFFPAYKIYQSSSKTTIQSERVDNKEIIELRFDSINRYCNKLNFESDLYAEGIDSIQIFIETIDNRLVLVVQKDVLREYKSYSYLPTITFSVNLNSDSIKSIKIVGKSNNENRKLIIGRITGSKRIELITENTNSIDSLLSKYPIENQNDTYEKIPNLFIRFHAFEFYSRLILKDCNTIYDSIQCISQFTNKLLNEYGLYKVYSIDKQELINRNALLTKNSNNFKSYYEGLKGIISSLNSCHMRLASNKQDYDDSPLQAIYFYNINNAITVSAIFDPKLENKVQLGDRLLSINQVPLEQLYHNFSTKVFASTPQQREIKITQKLLYLAREIFGDSLKLEFQNNTNNYYIELNKTNFSCKKIIPSDFKILSNNTIEKYSNIVYLKPVLQETSLIPFLFSHMTDLNHCSGLIIDLRGCSGGDNSLLTIFSFLISKKSLMFTSNFNLFENKAEFIAKPSNQINIQTPVVVLIDSRTVCFPELFINALRKARPNIYVIGASNTAGSAQGVIQCALPDKAELIYFECVTKDAFGNNIDNNIGIVPDTIIHFDSYKDLFPYNDKIKKLGLKYLGYSEVNKE